MTRRNIPHGTPAGRHMLSLPCCFFIPLHFNTVLGHSSSSSISCSLTLPCWGVSLLYKTERRSNCDWCESRRRAFPSMIKTIIYERMRENNSTKPLVVVWATECKVVPRTQPNALMIVLKVSLIPIPNRCNSLTLVTRVKVTRWVQLCVREPGC